MVEIYNTVYSLLYIYGTVKSSLDGQKKLNVHAPRDGTAAGRHGGAAR